MDVQPIDLGDELRIAIELRFDLAPVGEVTPDIVLVDFATPDAVRIVADIRRRTPNVKVVAITLGETEAEVIQLAEAGVAGYVLPAGAPRELLIPGGNAPGGGLLCPPPPAVTFLRRPGAPAAGAREGKGGGTQTPPGG